MSLYKNLQTADTEIMVDGFYKNELRKVLKINNTNNILTTPYSSDGLLYSNNINCLLEFKKSVDFTNIPKRCDCIIQCIVYLKKFKYDGKKIPSAVFIGDINECFVLDTKYLKKYLDMDIVGSASTAHLNNPIVSAALVDDTDLHQYGFYYYPVTSKFKLQEVVSTLHELESGDLTKIKINKMNMLDAYNTFVNDILQKNKLTVNQTVNMFVQLIINPAENQQSNLDVNKLITKNFGTIGIKSTFKAFFKKYEGIQYTNSEKEELTAYADRLIEDETRRRRGEFFTPTLWVDKCHEYLENYLGKDFREKYIVVDPACGTANLTRDYNFKELYLSTLEKSDIGTIKDSQYNPNAIIYQFDFLNDKLNKLPEGLKTAIKDKKDILFLLNPPYMKATPNKGNDSTDISNTIVGKEMNKLKYGVASSQLSSQFLYRILKLKKLNVNIKLAIFNKPNFLSSDGFKKLRNNLLDEFGFMGGFLFNASHFSDTASSWGISFNIWDNNSNLIKNEFQHDILDVGENGIYKLQDKMIYNCDDKVKSNIKVKPDITHDIYPPPIKSFITIEYDKEKLGYSGAIGYINNDSNNMMQQQVIFLASSVILANGNKVITEDNFEYITSLFTARKSIKGNWINDKDEYIAPDETHPDWQQFVNDSIVYSLFNNSSQQSSLRNITYKNKQWDIKNEFFWLSNKEMLDLADTNNFNDMYKDAKYNNKDRYVYEKLKDIKLSDDAQDVLDMASDLLRTSISHRITMNGDNPEYHLSSWDCGYAQLKLVWQKHYKEEFKEFRNKYKTLEQRLIPLVYDLGFLKK